MGLLTSRPAHCEEARSRCDDPDELLVFNSHELGHLRPGSRHRQQPGPRFVLVREQKRLDVHVGRYGQGVVISALTTYSTEPVVFRLQLVPLGRHEVDMRPACVRSPVQCDRVARLGSAAGCRTTASEPSQGDQPPDPGDDDDGSDDDDHDDDDAEAPTSSSTNLDATGRNGGFGIEPAVCRRSGAHVGVGASRSNSLRAACPIEAIGVGADSRRRVTSFTW